MSHFLLHHTDLIIVAPFLWTCLVCWFLLAGRWTKEESPSNYAPYYGAVSVTVFVLFYQRHYLSYLPWLEPWQMDRSSCRAWRWASAQAETRIEQLLRHLLRPGCCPTTIPSTPVVAVVGACASPTIPVPASARVLARLQSRQLDLSICQGSSRGIWLR